MNPENLLDFMFEWVIGLPVAITENSDYKLIRILGVLLFFIWAIPAVLISAPFILIFAIIEIIYEC
jgi:ABC-type sugar transport system permease subunit